MKLIILDRDGVINHDSDAFIKSPEEWVPVPGSLQAIARLNQAGYTVVVATNQSGVGRRLFDMTTLNAIHQKMHQLAQQAGATIDAVFYCPHMADDNCDCRKPRAGMFHEIARRYDISLKGVPTVGDSLRIYKLALWPVAARIWCKPEKAKNTGKRRPATGHRCFCRSCQRR
jgi:D-glycero-D-manno-heptose 1,7-bisphosphate phosphatase